MKVTFTAVGPGVPVSPSSGWSGAAKVSHHKVSQLTVLGSIILTNSKQVDPRGGG